MMINQLRLTIKKIIPNSVYKLVLDIFYNVKYSNEVISSSRIFRDAVRSKRGVEIGGPTPTVFRYILPVYSVIKSLDSVNFSANTRWEGSIEAGNTFYYYGKKPGKQLIADASDLSLIPTNSYDFLLSCNSLEHIANPIKALKEWMRIVKRDGYIVLILPNKENNFDCNRNITTFEHILEDYNKEVAENDLTHLEEVLELHDLSKDENAGSFEKFKQTSENNYLNREMHHHVFDEKLIAQLFQYLNITLVVADKDRFNHYALGKIAS